MAGRQTELSEFILESVRCFEGEQRAALRPITLLVGENSTGKTTFLGCFRVMSELIQDLRFVVKSLKPLGVDFNQEPFLMGSFRDIVRSRRGRDGRINAFRLGLVARPPRRTGLAPYPVYFTYSEGGSQPAITSYRMQFTEQLFIEVEREPNGLAQVSIPNHAVQLDFGIFVPAAFGFELLFLLSEGRHRNRETPNMAPFFRFLSELMALGHPTRGQASLEQMAQFIESIVPSTVIPTSVAPLRSKPKRTYDPIRESESPDGEHIPMLLMRLDRKEKSQWNSLHDHLVAFGAQSGLFSDIKVKRHGKQMSDPFQLQVKVRSGSHANIMDVGYGVSQSLPILVDLMNARPQTFLLQQPEIHLHPRGQAELASLFIQSWKHRKHRFLIETHSDHVVDRVRIAVRLGELKADDVSILYFEPKRNSVQIHNLSLDKQGNLLNAPPGYRDFFLRETDRLLGFRDD